LKTTVYLRVAKKPSARKGGAAVSATMTPQQRPLEDTVGRLLPTTSFAIALDIPDEAFNSAARVVAELKVPEERLEIAAEVLELATQEDH
jgi:hypothetical protein